MLDESLISIKLFIQQIQFHPTHFLSFFVLDSFDHFFHPTICKNDVILLQSNVKLDIKDSKKTNRSFGAKMADESMNSDSSIDSVECSQVPFQNPLNSSLTAKSIFNN